MSKLADLSQNIDPLAREYYKNFDLDIFQRKLNFIIKRISKLKTEKCKKVYNTELYASYLQIVEIFCINAFAVSDNDLLGNIFLSNFDIQKKIKDRFFEERNEKGENFILYLLNNFVFVLTDDKQDRSQQKRDYEEMTKEALDDYTKDKDFLNSYKHGFRVFAGGRSSLSIGFKKSSLNLQNFSSSVSYYKRSEGGFLRCDIYFNWDRVYAKACILISILTNMKRVYLSQGEVLNLGYVYPKNRDMMQKAYGCLRICR